jgi:hypothetical protein
MTAEEGTPQGGPALPGACLAPRDALGAAALFAAVLALYAATAQGRIYGHDGAFLVNAFALGAEGHSNSALYAGAAELARALAPGDGPTRPLLWLSHAGGALGVAAAYVLARALGAPARGAVFGAALLALAPAQWFYATAIETHALHVAAVGVAALLCVLGPWRRPWLARGLAAAGVLLLYPTHMTGLLLLPGWLLLARVGRARRAPPEAPAETSAGEPARDLAATGAVFAAALALSVMLANHLFGAGFTLIAGADAPTRFLEQFQQRFTLAGFWSGWALPLFLLLPVGLATLAAGRPGAPGGSSEAGARAVRAALAVLIAVPAVALLWLSIPERGAYFLGSAPFLAALCAFAPLPAGARGWWLAAGLVALQGIAGRGELAQHDALFPIAERAEAVRAAIGERGVVITLDPSAPRTKAWLPGVEDYDLSADLFAFAGRGAPPEEFAAFVVERVRPVLAETPVALDLTYRRLYAPPPDPALIARLEPYLVACEARLHAELGTRLVPHAWWPLLVLAP